MEALDWPQNAMGLSVVNGKRIIAASQVYVNGLYLICSPLNCICPIFVVFETCGRRVYFYKFMFVDACYPERPITLLQHRTTG